MTEKDAIEAEVVLDHESDDDDQSAREIAVATDILPSTLYVLPLSERPFFPAQALPILLNEDPWLPTVEAAADTDQQTVGLILVQPDTPENVTTDEFFQVGTIVRMHQLARSDGRIQFISQGLKRFRILQWLSSTAPYQARVEYLDDTDFVNTEELRAYSMAVVNTLKELVPLNPLYSEQLKFFLSRFNTNDPSPLADFAANITDAVYLIQYIFNAGLEPCASCP